MKNILVMGAGLVARPLVNYLLNKPDYRLVVADIDIDKAVALVAGRPNGTAKKLSADDANALAAEVKNADLAVSLLPAFMHPKVAAACVAAGRHLVTASYVSPAMRAFDGPAREKGVTLMNEVGLDPGIDHMEAMRAITKAREAGGRIMTFTSYCGGLPAAEANDNPFGYKFSWSPRGVLVAGKNQAIYLKDGRIVTIPAARLFADPAVIRIEGLGDFEGYPNRDSVAYREIYGITEARSILRGTLRYSGWCETMKAVFELNLLDETMTDWRGVTAADFLRKTAGLPAKGPLSRAIAAKLDLPAGSKVPSRLEYLGLFEEKPLPIEKGGAIDVMTALMNARLVYKPGERDLVILQHEFVIEYQNGKREKETSTLIDYGERGGDSSMSRTVGYPAAVAASLIADGRIRKPGVQVPTDPLIFRPILAELETLGIRFASAVKPA